MILLATSNWMCIICLNISIYLVETLETIENQCSLLLLLLLLMSFSCSLYSFCECLTNLRWQLLHVSFLLLLHSIRAVAACAMHIECSIEFADISLKFDGKRNFFYDCSSFGSVDVNFYVYNLFSSHHFPQFHLEQIIIAQTIDTCYGKVAKRKISTIQNRYRTVLHASTPSIQSINDVFQLHKAHRIIWIYNNGETLVVILFLIQIRQMASNHLKIMLCASIFWCCVSMQPNRIILNVKWFIVMRRSRSLWLLLNVMNIVWKGAEGIICNGLIKFKWQIK